MRLQGSKSIVVRNQFVALHRWDGAPAQVGFLGWCHRHTFHVLTTIEVPHGNRGVEFFCVQRQIDRIIEVLFFSEEPVTGVTPSSSCSDLSLPVISLSCEDMAEHIANVLAKAELRVRQVIVSEDNENGGVFTVS